LIDATIHGKFPDGIVPWPFKGCREKKSYFLLFKDKTKRNHEFFLQNKKG
jgi:hypothetical protein